MPHIAIDEPVVIIGAAADGRHWGGAGGCEKPSAELLRASVSVQESPERTPIRRSAMAAERNHCRDSPEPFGSREAKFVEIVRALINQRLVSLEVLPQLPEPLVLLPQRIRRIYGPNGRSKLVSSFRLSSCLQQPW